MAGSCQGDSGGPLLLPAGMPAAQQTVVGVTSYGNSDSLSLSIYDQSAPRIDVAPGATLALDRSVDTTEAEIVFDVIEPPGQPQIGISYPYVYISQWDPAGQKYVYISGQSYAVDKPTPVVKIDGPAGRYQFQAYATVRGSSTQFASSTIDLGQSVDTPAGSGVIVVPKDSSGNPTPIQLDCYQKLRRRAAPIDSPSDFRNFRR